MKKRHSADAFGFATLLKDTFIPARLNLGKQVLEGRKGVSDRIQYNQQNLDLLDNTHEYTFQLGSVELQVSLQLYENITNHYRLFCYTRVGNKQGMAFSLNLTTQQENKNIPLKQRITFREPHPGSVAEAQALRRKKQAALCAQLAALALNVEGTTVTLGNYDITKKQLINQTTEDFLHDFLVVSVLKGHYQGNKGYQLDKC